MTRSHHRRRGRRGPAAVLCALLAFALVPAPAVADPPSIDGRPTITGEPQVGSSLQASAAYEGVPSWRWYRCNAANPSMSSCSPISGATTTTYTPADADAGLRLRVRLIVRYRGESEREDSDPTGVVAAAPAPTPTPTATPTPAPSPTPTPTPEPPVSDPGPTAQTTAPLQPSVPVPQGAVLPAAAARPATMMSPVPVVRIRGRTTPTGARITMLSVRAPKGARISLRCYGRGCPARRWARTASTTRLLRFERVLRAGTKLVIRVTKAGRIGKYTTIVIRKNRVPKRSDRCLYPGRSRPASCPAA